MSTFKRVHLIVMDSVGIGEAPDAAEFNDFDVDTFGHIARERGGLNMPHMASLGLSNIKKLKVSLSRMHPKRIIPKCRKHPEVKIQ